MHPIPILEDLLVVSGVGVLVSVVLSRFRLPLVAGLLLTGAIIGPYGLGFVRPGANIRTLSEIGVGLLLFSIGLELSLRKLLGVLKVASLGGFLQVGLTVAGVVAVTAGFGQPLTKGLVLGFTIAMSSTAVVMSALQKRGELDAPHGRFVVGILIFQDICVIPLLLLFPVLAGDAKHSFGWELARSLGTAALIVVGTVAAARRVVPRLFRLVDATRAREIFMLAVLGLCLGVTWITSRYGLTASLGAFLAGLVLADSDFGERAAADVLPLRSVFTSIFFVSLGMLVDPGLFLRKPLETLLLVAAFVLGKGLVSSLAAVAMRFPSRVAWLSGVGLAQFGEFGFVLATLAHQLKILGPHELDLLIAAGVFSMFVTPFAMATAPHVTAGEKILQPLERLLGVRGIDEPAAEHRNLSGHVVIAGFGVGGRLLAEALRTHGIPYLVLELNAEKVRAARAGGEPIYYGDITSPEAMQHAGVERARALVVLINDPAAARRAVAAVRAYAPMTAVFIRARYFTDRPDLHRIGADQVVVEELEAALEVTARVLRHSGVEQTSIGKQIRTARAEAESEPPQP